MCENQQNANVTPALHLVTLPFSSTTTTTPASTNTNINQHHHRQQATTDDPHPTTAHDCYEHPRTLTTVHERHQGPTPPSMSTYRTHHQRPSMNEQPSGRQWTTTTTTTADSDNDNDHANRRDNANGWNNVNRCDNANGRDNANASGRRQRSQKPLLEAYNVRRNERN